jgi:hypothetical protein
MDKFTIAAAVLVASVGSAAGQQSTHAKDPIERLTSYPRSSVTPIEKAPTAGNSIPPGWQPAVQKAVIKSAAPSPGWHKKITLYHEQGGALNEHWERFQLYADRNDEVELRGECYSACTLVMSLLPRERICVGERASLHFHRARYGAGEYAGKPNGWATHLMYQSYPDDIRAWLDSKGGESMMPDNEFWTLLATDLWKMGYRKCGPG